MDTEPTNNANIEMSDGMVAQNSQALRIQTYCNSVAEQTDVNFGNSDNLKVYTKKINTGLAAARKHANNYLYTLQPDIIRNISSIDNYFSLYQAIPTVCPKGTTKAQWLNTLAALRDELDEYKLKANSTAQNVRSLHDLISTDSTQFQGVVQNLNTAVGGDNGILSHFAAEIDNINVGIDASIAAVVGGAFLTLTGGFAVAIGGVASFITAGTSTMAVIGGVAMLAAGVGGITAGSIALSKTLQARQSLYEQRQELRDEVKLATQFSTSFNGLFQHAQSAVDAASKMSNCWDALYADIDTMSSDLSTGIISTDSVRTLFLTGADQDLPKIKSDITMTKQQMAGVSSMDVPKTNTIAEYIATLAKK